MHICVYIIYICKYNLKTDRRGKSFIYATVEEERYSLPSHAVERENESERWRIFLLTASGH